MFHHMSHSASERVLSVTQRTDAALQQQNAELLSTIALYESERVTLLHEIDILHKVAFQDPLTGLLNRRGFEKALHRQVGLIQRYTIMNHVPFVAPFILMLDLDKFKQVNDIKGHSARDEMLQVVTEILRSVFHRDSDIIARLGGDEFLVMCSDASHDQIVERASELRKKMMGDTRFRLKDCLPVTASIGISGLSIEQDTIPIEMDKIYRLSLEMADKALYRAKEAGRNTISIAETDH